MLHLSQASDEDKTVLPDQAVRQATSGNAPLHCIYSKLHARELQCNIKALPSKVSCLQENSSHMAGDFNHCAAKICSPFGEEFSVKSKT